MMVQRLSRIGVSQIFSHLLKPQSPCVILCCSASGDHRLTTLGKDKGFKVGFKDDDVEKFKRRLRKSWKNMWSIKPYAMHGDFDYFSKFEDIDTVNSWIVTTDSDNNEGKSRAYFTQNKNNKGLFYGYLDTQPMKDGLSTRAGYCQIKCPLNQGVFGTAEPYDWTQYTHIVLRVRGDGRPYYLNIHMDEYFDIMENDQYNYTLFTRGGPYWQIAKIPFSKFYLTNEGRIQDKQFRLNQNLIRFFGISICDNVDGPFQLEIDYVALIQDASHSEYFAYEEYSKS